MASGPQRDFRAALAAIVINRTFLSGNSGQFVARPFFSIDFKWFSPHN
jgi:hypothetical protein